MIQPQLLLLLLFSIADISHGGILDDDVREAEQNLKTFQYDFTFQIELHFEQQIFHKKTLLLRRF